MSRIDYEKLADKHYIEKFMTINICVMVVYERQLQRFGERTKTERDCSIQIGMKTSYLVFTMDSSC